MNAHHLGYRALTVGLALALPFSAAAKDQGLVETDRDNARTPYLQSLGRTSVVIAWIASAPGGPALDYGTSLEYGSTSEAASDGARRHVTLSGLAPGTRYYYRVRAGDRVLASGEQYHFRTDRGPSDVTLSFFVTGDLGSKSGRQAVTGA